MGALRRVAPRKADLDRAIKAATDAGFGVLGIEIKPDGEFRILTGASGGAPRDELEEWRARRAARKTARSE